MNVSDDKRITFILAFEAILKKNKMRVMALD